MVTNIPITAYDSSDFFFPEALLLDYQFASESSFSSARCLLL